MSWKKVILATLAGGFAGSLGTYANEVSQGHHFAFTAGNIVIPAVSAILPTVIALFTKRPVDK